MVKAIDKLVVAGFFLSRSELIRTALREFLSKYEGEKRNAKN